MFAFQSGHTKLPSAYNAVSALPDRPDYDRQGLINLILKTNKSDSEIAELTKYSVAHVAKVRRSYGKCKRFVEHRSVDDIRRVRKLCEEGMDVEEIMEETGFAEGFVSRMTLDLRLLRSPKKLRACAVRAGMGTFAYVTLRRMEIMLRLGDVKEWDFAEAKKRLPGGDITPQQIEWMLKTGRVINICPSGEKLSARNKMAEAKEQQELKRNKFLRSRKFNQWKR